MAPSRSTKSFRVGSTAPGHCENIMDPRFAEMGIALAPGHAKHGLYWVQVLAEPRA